MLPLPLNLPLLRPPDRNIFGPIITKRNLEPLLHDPAAREIHHHDHRHGHPERVVELDQSELLVQLGEEFRRAGEGDAGHEDEAPVHALVLRNALAEGTALVVDGEGRDLLDQLQQVDGAVEQRGLELALQIDAVLAGFGALHVVGDVDEGDDVDGELAEYGADDVEVEDVWLWALFG